MQFYIVTLIFSLQDSIAKIPNIHKTCENKGIIACAVTDHGSCCSVIQHLTKAKSVKPLIGVELYVCDDLSKKEDRNFQHLVVIAKNKDGYRDLIRLCTDSNKPENFYYKPRVDLNLIKEHAHGNFVAFSGHVGSHLFNTIFDNVAAVHNSAFKSSIQKLISPNAIKQTSELALYFQDIFGKGNFFIEIQLIDENNIAGKVSTEVLREVSKKARIPCVATPDSHYCERADAINQRVVLANSMHATLREIQGKIVSGADVGMSAFFRSDGYHIPSYTELIAAGNTEGELNNTLVIADMCEKYTLNRQPSPAKFPCPNGLNSEEYLTELCRGGYRNKLDKIKKVMLEKGLTKEDFGNRFNHELEVIKEAKLEDYFLTVRDIIQYAQNNNIMVGWGRGSVGGSLIGYLLGIHKINSLEYNLFFERFYNRGRNTDGHVKMPDVDTDLEVGNQGRDKVINYIRDRFGRDKVSQIATYGRMQGRSALKDVLRCFEVCSFDEMGRITENIDDEASISDQLQLIKDASEDGEASIIEYCIDNYSKELSEWVYRDDKGNLQGPLVKQFEMAINLEGTRRSIGKHAGGVIISDFILRDNIPLVRDKESDELISGLSMDDAEMCGALKIDILGVNALNVLHSIKDMVNNE